MGDGKTILLVEDDKDLLELEEVIFSQSPYHCVSASSCADAEKMVNVHKPDLVFLDRHLPDGDALDFCKEWKKIDGLENMKIVMLTADENALSWDAGLSSGVDVFLTKPFSRNRLLLMVKELIG